MIIKNIKNYELCNRIIEKLSKIYKYIKLSGNTIYASSKCDKGGNPLVRIDSKYPIIAIMIKINNDELIFKSIVNTTENKGISSKSIDLILNEVGARYNIIIDNNINNAFWTKISKKYPSHKWNL